MSEKDFVQEWALRFGFLAVENAADSFESINEVASAIYKEQMKDTELLRTALEDLTRAKNSQTALLRMNASMALTIKELNKKLQTERMTTMHVVDLLDEIYTAYEIGEVATDADDEDTVLGVAVDISESLEDEICTVLNRYVSDPEEEEVDVAVPAPRTRETMLT